MESADLYKFRLMRPIEKKAGEYEEAIKSFLGVSVDKVQSPAKKTAKVKIFRQRSIEIKKSVSQDLI